MDRAPLFTALATEPLADHAADWWLIPGHFATIDVRCPDCAVGEVEDLLDACAWTVARADALAPCECCGMVP